MIRLVLSCLTIYSLAMGEKIHHKMSVEQIAEIFQKPHHDLVPPYEVMQFQISGRNKRDPNAPRVLQAEAFGEEIKIFLLPSIPVLAAKNTPVFLAKTTSNKSVQYDEVESAMINLGNVFTDPFDRASLLVKRDTNGQYLIDGFIIGSKKLVVKSLPESTFQNVTNTDFNSSRILKRNKSAFHIVFKMDEDQFGNSSNINVSIESEPQMFSNNTSNFNISEPFVFFPEIMVVVDYDCFVQHGKNINRVLTYVLAFWNGVDLLYRKLTNPAILFNIARIIIATDSEATPYISENILINNSLNADKAWEAKEKYYFEKLDTFPAISYDAVFTMTSRNLLVKNSTYKAAGLATFGGICTVNFRKNISMNIAIIQDDGLFGRVFTAAHEFGHLLNLTHDGTAWDPSEPSLCDPYAGYLMNPTAITSDKSYDFSPCSLRALKRLSRDTRKRCLLNVPSAANFEQMTKILPSALLSRDHHCNKLNYGSNCYVEAKDFSPCNAIYCNNSTFCIEYTSVLPPDGTYCGVDKVCMNGRCMPIWKKTVR